MLLEDIFVSGRSLTSPEEVVAALGPIEGRPLLEIDPDGVRQAVEDLPWVENVRVERRLPGALHLALTERQPMALWQTGDTFRVLDTDGNVVGVDPTSWSTRLPLVVGDGAPGHTAELLDMLAPFEHVSKRVVAASYVGERRWTLHIDALDDQGLVVLLPEKGAKQALAALEDLAVESDILARDIEVIDMRLDDRLVVRPRKQETDTRPASPVRPVPQSTGPGQDT